MSWFTDWFRPRPRPPVQPPVVLPPGDIRIHSNIEGEMTDLPVLHIDGRPPYTATKDAAGNRVTFTMPGTEKPWGYAYTWDGNTMRMPDPLPGSGDHEGPTFKYALPVEKPAGIVQLAGRAWVDGNGPYYPLTSTLLWALGGWKRGEQGRVRENFRFIKAQGGDSVRILGQVNWAGEQIDENWSDYPQMLGQVLDCAYDEGLRTKITCIGGGASNPLRLAEVVRDVVNDNRRPKILMQEAVNEGNASYDVAVAVARILMGTGMPTATGLGNQGLDNVRSSGDKAGSSVDVLHTERTLGGSGEPGGPHARQVRQAWDFRYLGRASDDGEPPGPGSSVEELSDPEILASLRAAAIICGAGSFCLHTGSGVFGRSYMGPRGYRYANLWEVPNIAAMYAAVRHAANILPRGIENWAHFNTNHPVVIDSGDCNKLYGCRTGNTFVEIIIGATSPIGLKLTQAGRYDVYDPATGAVVQSSDGKCVASGAWGYVIIGTVG